MLKLITSFKFSTRKHMSGKKIIYALQNGNKRLAKISSKIHTKKIQGTFFTRLKTCVANIYVDLKILKCFYI